MNDRGYELHLGDCIDVMKLYDSFVIDCVVTDPPYGIGESGKKNASREKLAKPKDYGDYQWDKKITQHHIDEMVRVSMEQVIFGGNYYAHWLAPSSSWIVWDKQNTGDFADCELAWTSHKKAVRKIEWMWNGMIRKGSDVRVHPTQKPIGVMRWIIQNYTSKGDTILDPFMGSGTTGVACMMEGRKFIGIEICKEYYDIAETRIRDAAMQPRLPEPKQKSSRQNHVQSKFEFDGN